METITRTNLEREVNYDPRAIGEKILGYDESQEARFKNSDFADLFQESGKAWQSTLRQAGSMNSEEIKKLIVKENIDTDTNIQRFRTWEYILALRYIKSSNEDSTYDSLSDSNKHLLANAQNQSLRGLHLKINTALKSYLSPKTDTVAKEKLQLLLEDEKREENPLGNIKIFRGFFCNAGCIICFQENSANKEVDAFVKSNRQLEYTDDQLMRALLYGRLAYRLREVSFSGGEALVNKPKLFANEVALAREAGYPQISTMTNGRLMTEDQVKPLIESGMTHFIISLHTVDPHTHFKILNWKDAGRPIAKAIAEIERSLTHAEKNLLFKHVAGHFLETIETVDIPEELTEVTNEIKNKVSQEIKLIYQSIIQNIQDVVKLSEIYGTKVRLNLAYNPQTIGIGLSELMDFAKNLGVHEVTLIEMIPGNDTAKSLHVPLPDDTDFIKLGFTPRDNRDWQVGGIRIYEKSGYPSVATCNFGQLNQLTMAEGDDSQYTNFGGQSKEIILMPDGSLSSATYSKNPILF